MSPTSCFNVITTGHCNTFKNDKSVLVSGQFLFLHLKYNYTLSQESC